MIRRVYPGPVSDHHDDVLSSLAAGRTPDGLPTTTRGGPDVSVRPAIPADADRIGEIHAVTMRAAVGRSAGIEADDPALGVVDAGDLALTWANAIGVSAPGHRVLTALAGARIGGVAAIAPAAADVPEASTIEALALEIAPGEERAGHGARLLAACADLATDAGARALTAWVARGDEARTRFLTAAGLAPSGRRRYLPVGPGEVVQDQYWAALGG
jgi:GNAT superfamily N-acetyltransferase